MKLVVLDVVKKGREESTIYFDTTLALRDKKVSEDAGRVVTLHRL
ncbi:MAG TPA: hypothetical protein VNF06_03080 [Candidatus Aquilonibacter sp.]|nr:hypothetical protein [Candidatus Aquilonibacter sp.]